MGPCLVFSKVYLTGLVLSGGKPKPKLMLSNGLGATGSASCAGVLGKLVLGVAVGALDATSALASRKLAACWIAACC